MSTIDSEPNAETVAEREDRTDKVVLMLLCESSFPWSVEEIARELQDESRTADAVRRLTEVGLAHRLGDFVFPTRTARRADEIDVGTI
jgi:hypothetical protein